MIRKGEPWGSPVTLSGSEPRVASDPQLAALLSEAHERGEQPPIVVLTGGDLHFSLGGAASEQPHALPIDLLDVQLDGRQFWAVAHVVMHARFWAGDGFVAMNGTHLGEWNLGPKAHPNDGVIDVTYGAMRPADRWAARRRAPTGSHIPHPGLTTKRVRHITWEAPRAIPAYVDGVAVGRATTIEIAVVPDVGTVVTG